MSEVFDLFILEDNDAAYDSFNSLIEDYNKENEIKIKTVRFKEVKQALNAIKSGWYDGAIIDIRLSTSDDSENGNEIIREIKNNLRFPIRVYTGYDDIDDDLQDQNEFYKIYKRTDIRFQEVLVELINIYKTGITKILGKKGTIEDYLRDIFWNHLSSSFGSWIKEAQTKDNIEKILLRYTLSHLQEYLDKDDSGDYDEYHPSEFYIKDPINKKLHNGMILKQKSPDEYFIVLTPSCDLANEKNDKVLMCKIIQDVKEFSVRLERNKKCKKACEEKKTQTNAQMKKYNSAKGRVMEITRNSFKLQYHYVPKINSLGGFIDFQDISVINKADVESNYDKIASVTNNFRKEIVARFSHYYMRQGQPCFIPDKIFDLHT